MIGGLLVLAFSKSRVALVLACLLIPWIDERFLLAVPLCIAIRVIDADAEERRRPKELILDGLAVLVASVAYPLLRILLVRCGSGGEEAGTYIVIRLPGRK